MDLPVGDASGVDGKIKAFQLFEDRGTGRQVIQPAQPDLFPSNAVKRAVDARISRVLDEAMERVKGGVVNSTMSHDELSRELGAFDFVQSHELSQVIDWAVARLTDGIVHTAHPRYFGLFNPSPNFPSICADRIVAAFNPQLASARTSPFPVLLEAHLISEFVKRIGMPVCSRGHFTSGGSEANATALICALTRRDPAYARNGVRTFIGAPRVYVSRDAHLAWLKIAHQVGIGRDSVRLVSTDGAGRMDSKALSAALDRDLADGDLPVMIASTAGTTNAGMVDPLRACADISRDHGIWHHVDAAWGGAAIASERHRHVIDGIDHADSITIDPHKWFATTLGCGMFLTAHPQTLSDAFGIVMDCMPSHDVGFDPYTTTMQWSRRFLGLRLFLSLATAGWSGFAQHVDRSIALASELRNRLVISGWQARNNSELAVLCMRPPIGSADVQSIVARVVREGVAWISAVEFEGEVLIRACVSNGETTLGDVDILCDRLNIWAAP